MPPYLVKGGDRNTWGRVYPIRPPVAIQPATRLYGKLEATDTSLLTWLGGLSNAENRQRRQHE